MKPDEALDLLDGTTPAEEWWHSVKWGRVRHLEPVGIDAAGELDVSEEDAALILAAPTLAAMIAGMREEWGVLYESHFGGLVARHEQWKDSDGKFDRDAAHRYAARCERSGHENVRVVRRHVTEPEAVDAVD